MNLQAEPNPPELSLWKAKGEVHLLTFSIEIDLYLSTLTKEKYPELKYLMGKAAGFMASGLISEETFNLIHRRLRGEMIE